MTRSDRITVFALCVTAIIAAAYGLLPKNWIELQLGVDPDGGSGLLELLLVAVPVAMGLRVAVSTFRRLRSAR
jgi:hypothetical protein